MLESINNLMPKISGLFAILFVLSGCVSFVNIPADEKDTAINAVNLPPVPGVMAYALAYAANLYPAEGAVALALPAPAGTRTFEIAMHKVARGAAPWAGVTDPRATYRVLSVRVRGSSAVVDVLLPESINLLDGKYLLEINLNGHLNGWSVIGVKRLIPTADRLARAAIPMGIGSTRAIHAPVTNEKYPENTPETAVELEMDTATPEQSEPATDPNPTPEASVVELEISHAHDNDKLRPIQSVPPEKK